MTERMLSSNPSACSSTATIRNHPRTRKTVSYWLPLLLLVAGSGDWNPITALAFQGPSPLTARKHRRCGGSLLLSDPSSSSSSAAGCFQYRDDAIRGSLILPKRRNNRFALSASRKDVDNPTFSDADLRQEFNSIDTDRNGELDKEEINDYLTFVPMSIVNQLFDVVDYNNDGKICFEEYKTIRQEMSVSPRVRLYELLDLPIVEIFNALAVILCSFLVAVSTLQSLPPVPIPDSTFVRSVLQEGLNLQITADGTCMDTLNLINTILQYFNVIFALDFFVRWYAATGNFKLDYLKSPLVILDVVVVLVPLSLQRFFPFVTVWNSPGLQNLLLLRILRVRRVLTDINTFSRFEIALGLPPKAVRPFQLQLARVLLSIFTLLSVSSGLIYTTEHGVNPDIPDYFAALYFGLTTLTTVGFGDIAPITPGGRFVVCASILAGTAIIPAQAASLLDAILAFQNEREKKEQPLTLPLPRSPNANVNNGDSQIMDDNNNNNDFPNGQQQPPSLDDSRSMMTIQTTNAFLPPPTTTTTMNNAVDHGSQQQQPEQPRQGKCCSVIGCEDTQHRTDAGFCWSCGSKLLLRNDKK